MKYGKFIDNRTIKTGPIKRTIQKPAEIVKYRSNNMARYGSVDLRRYDEDIAEGVIWYSGSNIIYKVSPKMITQSPFDYNGSFISGEDKDILNNIWEGNLRYYVPEMYFIIDTDDRAIRVNNVNIIFEKNIFFPVLNLFNPGDLRLHLSGNKVLSFSRIHSNINDYLISGVCTGSALSGSTYDNSEDFLYHIGDICNTILSAPSNSDLIPNSSESTVWSEGLSSSSMGLDFILRSLSNISQKMTMEDYLELLRKSHQDPILIFVKLLTLNSYTEDEERELTEVFLRTQHSLEYIKTYKNELFKQIRDLREVEEENGR